MGCAQSRIDNEESVARCKDRKILMKDAVAARNAFASGHSGYVVALKNTGAALSDYGHGETEDTTQLHHLQQPLDSTTEPPPPPPPPPIDNLPPPPPPLPSFSPSPINLKRTTSMPEIPMKLGKPGRVIDSVTIAEEDEEEDHEVDEEESGKGLRRMRGSRNGVEEMGSKVTPSSPPRTPEMKLVPPMPESKGMAWDYFFMMDNMAGSSMSGEDESRGENDGHANMGFGEAQNVAVGGNLDDGVEPKTPEKVEEKLEETPVKQIEHSHTAPPEFRRAVKVASSVSLMEVLNQIDDHFLRASESAQEVSKMLEATRLHYHSNFADNRGMYIYAFVYYMMVAVTGNSLRRKFFHTKKTSFLFFFT